MLADRGFDISDDIGVHAVRKLAIQGTPQLTQKEVEFSQQLTRVRIHVQYPGLVSFVRSALARINSGLQDAQPIRSVPYLPDVNSSIT